MWRKEVIPIPMSHSVAVQSVHVFAHEYSDFIWKQMHCFIECVPTCWLILSHLFISHFLNRFCLFHVNRCLTKTRLCSSLFIAIHELPIILLPGMLNYLSKYSLLWDLLAKFSYYCLSLREATTVRDLQLDIWLVNLLVGRFHCHQSQLEVQQLNLDFSN